MDCIKGVIDRINGDTVRVKLYPNSYINLPSIVFEDKEIIQQGQHIKYMIKNGYPKISVIKNKRSHPEKDDLLNLLNNFKYKEGKL